jgi:hypothetical protein
LPEMLQLRVHRSALTYEVALSPYIAAVIDTPGEVAGLLASEFNHLNMDLSDIEVDDDGALEDKGLSCELDKLNASVVLRADRFEIHFDAADEIAHTTISRGVWQVLAACSPRVNAKSHSVLFQMDCEFSAGTYSAALQTFCMPPTGLPKGTETAVVYYLPRDRTRGLLDSSIVLNRSAEVEGGILLEATIVFDGENLGRDDAVSAGRERLNELLRSLNIMIGDC